MKSLNTKYSQGSGHTVALLDMCEKQYSQNCDISKWQKTAMTFFSQATICYKWQLLCCAILFWLSKALSSDDNLILLFSFVHRVEARFVRLFWWETFCFQLGLVSSMYSFPNAWCRYSCTFCSLSVLSQVSHNAWKLLTCLSIFFLKMYSM